jgi:hypothetical protein
VIAGGGGSREPVVKLGSGKRELAIERGGGKREPVIERGGSGRRESVVERARGGMDPVIARTSDVRHAGLRARRYLQARCVCGHPCRVVQVLEQHAEHGWAARHAPLRMHAFGSSSRLAGISFGALCSLC